jgi:hypothetical protein
MGWLEVLYNNDDETVTIEAYIDKTTDGTKPGTFTKGEEENCQLPIVNFRWDHMDRTEFKWLSVREIQPPASQGVHTTS